MTRANGPRRRPQDRQYYVHDEHTAPRDSALPPHYPAHDFGPQSGHQPPHEIPGQHGGELVGRDPHGWDPGAPNFGHRLPGLNTTGGDLGGYVDALAHGVAGTAPEGQDPFQRLAQYPVREPAAPGYEPALRPYPSHDGYHPGADGQRADYAHPADGLSGFGGNPAGGHETTAPTLGHSQLRGGSYDHYPHGHRPAGLPPQPDADLGGLTPGMEPAYGMHPGSEHWAHGQTEPVGGQWMHEGVPSTFGADGYPDHAPVYAAHGSGDGALMQTPDGYDDLGEEDYEEEAPGGLGRKLLLGAALAGSIVVGGGIALAYGVLYGGPSSADGTPPVVRADASPAKVEPGDPGGTRFPHTDSRLMKKMGERLPQGSGDAAPSQSPDGNRVKVVTTMTFDRNGRVVVSKRPGEGEDPGQAPAGTGSAPVTGAAPAAPQQASSPLPGTTLVTPDGFGPPPGTNVPPARAPEGREPPQQTAAVEQPRPPAASRRVPVRRGRHPPLPERSGRTDHGAGQSGVPAANVQPVVARTPPQRVAPVPTEPAEGGASGYVAVLSTKSTRIDALKSYADLQQRYGGVLNATIPDVQQADLRARGLGMMYRVVVGPPGSRQAAVKVCERLRTAGYKGCWVKAY